MRTVTATIAWDANGGFRWSQPFLNVFEFTVNEVLSTAAVSTEKKRKAQPKKLRVVSLDRQNCELRPGTQHLRERRGTASRSLHM